MTDLCKTEVAPHGSLDRAARGIMLPSQAVQMFCLLRHHNGATLSDCIVTPSESAAVSSEQ